LGAEVEYRLDLVLVDGALQRVVVLEPAVHDVRAEDVATPDELRLRIPVTHERDDVCALIQKPLHEPGANDARRSRDKNPAAVPFKTCSGHQMYSAN
jgi:hypothetical protein